MNRRNFLKFGSASLATAATLSSLNVLANESATNSDDYKALVCVFLYGGMDNYDTIIPFDDVSYQGWAAIRAPLLSRYATSRMQSNLHALNTPARFGARKFALAPEMTQLATLYNQGNMAIVGNVGPLLAPTQRAMIEANTASLPARLFSHNDQQSTWMSGSPEGAQFGWAGKISDALVQGNIANDSPFSAITMSSGELLITGEQTAPYHLIGGNPADITVLKGGAGDLKAQLEQHFAATGEHASNLLKQDMIAKQQSAYHANALYKSSVSSNTETTTAFPNSFLGQQLASVANVISSHQQLGTNRQVFMVTLGGFDTHSDQARELPELQTTLDQAIGAFASELQANGLFDKVTLFTASDFGRTLAVNGDGTDHGWGSHHFVMGGAVNGGTIYGDLPPAEFDHSLDVGGGRLIPTTSTEQYAANFASWMGVNETEISALFPTLREFGERPDFMM